MGHYVFDPKAASSSQATKGQYFDQSSREKEVTAKGKTLPWTTTILNCIPLVTVSTTHKNNERFRPRAGSTDINSNVITKYHVRDISNISPLEIYSTTAEFVKNVGKRYADKQFSEEASKSVDGQGEAAIAAAGSGSGGVGGDKQSSKSGFGGLDMDSHYAECYPGGMEEYDATYDSDEDVDFSKMDMVSI